MGSRALIATIVCLCCAGCVPQMKERPHGKDCIHTIVWYGPIKMIDAIRCGEDKFRPLPAFKQAKKD